jgi:hypothetical protein
MPRAERVKRTEPVAVEPESKTAGLRGRVDAVEGQRLFGWAWHPDRPADRLDIKVFVASKLIATAKADKPRIDLRRNGIGDGSHAFDLELDAKSAAGSLRVVAVHPDGGEDLELDIPSDEERTAAAAFAASFGPVLDRLETAILAQRRMQNGHANSLGELTATAKRLADVAVADGGLVETVQDLRQRQQAIADRLAELEVFLVRFDGVIGSFHVRLEALARQHVHPIKGHLLWLAAAVGLLAGVALAAAINL